MHELTVIQVVATVTAFALGATKLFTATVPLWGWAPPIVQRFLPGVVLVVGALPSALAEVTSWNDFAVAVLGALALALPGRHTDIPKEHPPETKVPPTPTPPDVTPLALFLLVCLSLSAQSCASAKPVARTVSDLAQDACSLFFAEKQGLSVEDAARAFCSTHEKVKPFLDELLAAQERAGAKASAALGADGQ
jgi:hypothetical protein